MEEKQLIDKVLRRIGRAERKRRIAKAVAFAAGAAGSASLAVFGWFSAMDEAGRTGFFSFASLLFSDFSIAVGNFWDFFFSITESFPLVPVILLLTGVFFAVWSLGNFLSEATKIRRHSFL